MIKKRKYLMIKTEKIDLTSKSHVNRFIQFPFTLYKNCPQWVPPIIHDVRLMLNKEKHPYYEHSDGDFFLASNGNEVLGRVAVLENRQYNNYHNSKKGNFYLFECVDDIDVVKALFERVFEWCRKRHLTTVVGPKGYGLLDGYGVLIEGYEHRQMMMMMNYNLPYYSHLLSEIGFEKEVDFVSHLINPSNFRLPERVHEISRRIQRRGNFRIHDFHSKRELIKWGAKVAKLYNQSFINNWEYAPITEREIQFIVDNVLMVADYRLIKIMMHNDEVIGFLFAFPDVSRAIQRNKGRLHPVAIADMLIETKRTKWVAFNGGGVLPEYHGRGGNALLYAEMENTIRKYHFEHAEFTQIAETAVQMRKDLTTLGGQPYKNHRVFRYQL